MHVEMNVILWGIGILVAGGALYGDIRAKLTKIEDYLKKQNASISTLFRKSEDNRERIVVLETKMEVKEE